MTFSYVSHLWYYLRSIRLGPNMSLQSVHQPEIHENVVVTVRNVREIGAYTNGG